MPERPGVHSPWSRTWRGVLPEVAALGTTSPPSVQSATSGSLPGSLIPWGHRRAPGSGITSSPPPSTWVYTRARTLDAPDYFASRGRTVEVTTSWRASPEPTADRAVLLMAHYDAVPTTPGADHNAAAGAPGPSLCRLRHVGSSCRWDPPDRSSPEITLRDSTASDGGRRPDGPRRRTRESPRGLGRICRGPARRGSDQAVVGSGGWVACRDGWCRRAGGLLMVRAGGW